MTLQLESQCQAQYARDHAEGGIRCVMRARYLLACAERIHAPELERAGWYYLLAALRSFAAALRNLEGVNRC